MSTNISYCSFKVFTNFLLIGFLHSKNALKKVPSDQNSSDSQKTLRIFSYFEFDLC
ncbi:hypothetical protein CHCC20488_4060 [Bacillus paralicheniformis]|nr:hypothetical protein SC10_B2orf05470 [Bacillus paralicheniformis]OLG04630.1 hypothetical protein B4125_2702 [Bacillus paralicheniformis]TWK39652.1 hypothetical protein CHCC20347_4408 [Bacillus paralicheniformis]TWN35794.1 hypothetical protein CHCC14523_3675 [Bacillus paralicheniformis]TWO04685.1 hypothetical protein CHCC20488_4060 [Bacillus paralicheniformis]